MQRWQAPKSWLLLFVILFTALYLVILVVRPSEALFGVDGEWVWTGHPPSPTTYSRWWPAILGLSIFVLGSVWFDKIWERTGKRVHVAGLFFLMGMIVVLQVLLKFIHYRFPMEYYLYRAIGPSDGFWRVAIFIDSIHEYLRTYPEQMMAVQGITIHPPVHPPGNIVYLWLWKWFFEGVPDLAHSLAHWLRGYACATWEFVTLQDAQIAATLGQMMLVPLTSLTILPLYSLGKKLGGARSGWRAATLYVVVPAVTLFTLRWDTVYPFYLISALYVLHYGLEHDQTIWWFVAGLIVSFASFFSFGNLSFGLGLGFYALGYLWLYRRGKVWQTWRGWLAMAVGGGAIWGLYQLLMGVSFGEVLSTSMQTHLELIHGRSYWPWFFYNLYDLVTFVGVPSGFLFVVETAHAWPQLLKRRDTYVLLPVFALSGAVLTMTILGIVRGEAGRMWLPWMAGISLVAALFFHRQGNRPWYFRGCLLLMALQTLMATLYLRVSSPMMPAYQPRDPIYTVDEVSIEHPLNIRFGESITLLGYAIESQHITPEEEARITLYWEAQERLDLPYTVFVHILDTSGSLLAQHDSQPMDNKLPTSCWLPDEIVPDTHIITIPVDAPPGDYSLAIGLYYLPSLERLPILEGGNGNIALLPSTVEIK